MTLFHAHALKITVQKNIALVIQWAVNVHNIVYVNNAKITASYIKVQNR